MNTTNTGLAPGSEWQLMLTLGKSDDVAVLCVIAVVVTVIAVVIGVMELTNAVGIGDFKVVVFFTTTVFVTIL